MTPVNIRSASQAKLPANSQASLRIVSLIPSATEIVCALGYGDYLVGRSHECDYPLAVTELPICTEPKFDPIGTSAEIHGRVTQLLASALSVYRVKTDILADLRPTHIITQAQCEVCAVSLGDVEKAVTELVQTTPDHPPIQVVSLQPECLADLWQDMARVASALRSSSEAAPESPSEPPPEPASGSKTDDIIAALKAKITPSLAPEPRPKVACIEWTEPLMAAGNWVPELVELAGGQDCFGVAGAHSDWMTWDDLTTADPDIIIVLPCGYDLAQTKAATLEMAQKNASWQQLKAVQNGQVYLTDGNQYFNRPGPRLVESWEILTEIIHQCPVNEARQSQGQGQGQGQNQGKNHGWERFE
ncbi:MAG: cobalamin-binding protein [Cyanobacteria bacterium J06649_5]